MNTEQTTCPNCGRAGKWFMHGPTYRHGTIHSSLLCPGKKTDQTRTPEHWEAVNRDGIAMMQTTRLGADGGGYTVLVADFEFPEDRDRFLACVNGCAKIKHPEKILNLINELEVFLNNRRWTGFSASEEELAEALAALGVEES